MMMSMMNSFPKMNHFRVIEKAKQSQKLKLEQELEQME